ncbi:MAG TPA: ABC transporter ATP-binding protein [Blastocatellia bacterium]|nr:ABC transporter ATP-binding protein [Blastocatellia bacterium]
MSAIIEVDNLSKQYRIGTRERHDSLRELIAGGLSSAYRRLRTTPETSNIATFKSSNEFWALKDVSFDVKAGEVVGIIGRNGAGKSTLLKILSRITEPTTGSVRLFGRVGSLLEVGTGFHPELTGRENIYLNGAILGMHRSEIDRKFDEIVAFADIDRFIDTPVKRYSSGMYVRLAFAVAAHLEPEILLVDEVLSVGDAEFQKKCLGKMKDVAGAGRTVLFVSHNMSAVGRLCSRVIWVREGQVASDGPAREVIGQYLGASGTAVGFREWTDLYEAPGDEFVRVTSVAVTDLHHNRRDTIHQDEPFLVTITYRVLKSMMNANVGFELRVEDGTPVFRSFDADNPDWSGRGRTPGFYRASCKIPAHLLNEGSYSLTLLSGIPFVKLNLEEEAVIRIDIAPGVTDQGPAARMGVRRPGVVAPALDWSVSTPEEHLGMVGAN